MESIISEWLNLVLRWTHLITGIAWIGSSFLFMWLDSHLEKPNPPKKGVDGELWMTHSGGFYVVEKMHLAPDEVPKTLHWFKWEAAFTLISGFLLLGLVYYMGAEIYLIDASVAALSQGEAIAIGIGVLIAGWFVYDGLYRSPLRHHGVLVEAIGFALLIGLAYGLSQVFSARGAYMHVGAMLGTIMVANVWMIIIPRPGKAGRGDPGGHHAGAAPGVQRQAAIGAQQLHDPAGAVHHDEQPLPLDVRPCLWLGDPDRAVHRRRGGAPLVQPAQRRHAEGLADPRGRRHHAALITLTMPAGTLGTPSAGEDEDAVSFAQAYDVIAKRCVTCHAAKPADENFDKPPKNVVFETAAQIRAQAGKIKAVAVLTKTMPLGNTTKMTDAERRVLGRWIAQGAEIE